MLRVPKVVLIVSSIIISFFISSLLYSRYFKNPSEFDAVALKNDTHALITSVTSFHIEIPHINLVSQTVYPTSMPPSSETIQNNEEPTSPSPTTYQMGYENTPAEIPTSTPYIQPINTGGNIVPTYGQTTSPTRFIPQSQPTTYVPKVNTPPPPTSAPQPTKAPKPTKAPDLFPIDASLRRPGTTVDELFTIAAQKACIPKAVLRTIASIESGGFFDTVIPKYLLLYNSYNWWNSPFLTEEKRLCSGYAYDMNTGLVPADSKFAGYQCRAGSGSGLAVMGCMASSPREFSLYKGDVSKSLGIPVSQIDRRIILDSLILTGFAIQKEVHATSCSSWSAAQMVKGACSYYGSCGFNDKTYYCNTFCRNIKNYGGGDCSGAVAQYKDSCWK